MLFNCFICYLLVLLELYYGVGVTLSLESNRILNWIVFLPIIGVIVTTTILAVIYIRYENNIYNKNIEDAKIKYLKESKIKSQERIENISSLLRINERLLKAKIAANPNKLNLNKIRTFPDTN